MNSLLSKINFGQPTSGRFKNEKKHAENAVLFCLHKNNQRVAKEDILSMQSPTISIICANCSVIGQAK